jgi:hypothetical protein
MSMSGLAADCERIVGDCGAWACLAAATFVFCVGLRVRLSTVRDRRTAALIAYRKRLFYSDYANWPRDPALAAARCACLAHLSSRPSALAQPHAARRDFLRPGLVTPGQTKAHRKATQQNAILSKYFDFGVAFIQIH